MPKTSYAEFKKIMATYDEAVSSDMLVKMESARVRGWYSLMLDTIGFTVFLGNYFDPKPGEGRNILWLALAAAFLVAGIFSLVKIHRLAMARTLLAEELYRLKQEGAADPMDMFNLLGGLEGWRKRVDAEEAEEAAVKRAQDTTAG